MATFGSKSDLCSWEVVVRRPTLAEYYQTQETGIACGDTEVTLSGQTLSGQFIEGSDSIRTVDCTSSRPFGRRQPQRIELVDRERPAEPVEQQKVE